MASLVAIGPVVLEMSKMCEVYRQTDERWTTGDQESSFELTASPLRGISTIVIKRIKPM